MKASPTTSSRGQSHKTSHAALGSRTAATGSQRFRHGRAIVTACMLVAAVGATFFIASRQAGGQANPQQEAPALSCSTLARILLRDLEITPTTLAALDASDQQVRDIVLASRGLCESSGGTPTSYALAQRAFEHARERVQSLDNLRSAGRSTRTTGSELAQAQSELQVAQVGVEDVKAQMLTAINAVLNEQQRASLATIRGNLAMQPSIPVEYAVTTRSEAELVALRDSLAEQRRLELAGTEGGAAFGTSDGQAGHDAQASSIAALVRDRRPAIAAVWTAALAD